MEQKTFKISYSILVNGDEYPKEINIQAEDQREAEAKLNNLVFQSNSVAEVVITEVVCL